MIVYNFFQKNGLLFEFDTFLMKLTDRIEIFIILLIYIILFKSEGEIF